MNTFHNALVLFLFSLTSLLPAVPFSTARPTVEPPRGSLSIPQSPEFQGLWTHHTRGRGRNSRVPFATIRATSMEKRTPPGYNPSTVKMNMMTFTRVGFITPIVSAARALEDFYSSIAIRAAGAWAEEPVSENFSIQEGNFRLTFSSIGDPIPWNFVKDMAEKLWECACLGMADLFDVMYMDDAGQVAVSISLRLADGASSSSSGTDFREGSVPSVTSP